METDVFNFLFIAIGVFVFLLGFAISIICEDREKRSIQLVLSLVASLFIAIAPGLINAGITGALSDTLQNDTVHEIPAEAIVLPDIGASVDSEDKAETIIYNIIRFIKQNDANILSCAGVLVGVIVAVILASYSNKLRRRRKALKWIIAYVVFCAVVILIANVNINDTGTEATGISAPTHESEIMAESTGSEVSEEILGLAAGAYHSVWIMGDGNVNAVGKDEDGRLDVADWTDIVKVSAASHTVGLRSDGTVVAVGDNSNGKCNVDRWENIIDIDAGDYNTIALKDDGTVVISGDNVYGQCDISSWSDIVQVQIGEKTSYGLKSNGTVVASGSNASGQRDVSGWHNIKAISAGTAHVVGLREDGTVVAAGSNGFDQCDVSDWKDIVAISAGSVHTVGLKADGTVVATGTNASGQCNASWWINIVDISAGLYHTIGLKADGTLVAVGNEGFGQCDIS